MRLFQTGWRGCLPAVEPELVLARDGAVVHRGAAICALPMLAVAFADIDPRLPGTRLTGDAGEILRPLLKQAGPIGAIAAAVLGDTSRPVRAILFDKNPATNWRLGWHQDRVICVRERRDVAGFSAWTVKQGALHVAPPFAVLAAMVTLRVHLDPVPESNAPLLIVPGSHRLGRIAEGEIERVVARCGTRACLAEAGDIWCYSTPIVHASARADRPAQRRVLQVDFAAEDLPADLQWTGV